MPTLSGMKGAGYYDQNSDFQRDTIAAFFPWIDAAVERLTLPDEPQPITVADFGCSTGSNSILSVGHAIAALRRRRTAQAICAIHSDLPSNDFNQMFANLFDPRTANYLQAHGTQRAHVYAGIVGGSFFGPLLPPRSVHLATTFTAVCWMDRVPDVPIPEFVSYLRGSAAAQDAYALQAERDLTIFLQGRATELTPGGRLLIATPGSDGTVRCGDGIYDVLTDAGVDLVTAGQIDPARWEKVATPVYFRTVQELQAPLERAASPVRGRFAVERAETVELPIGFVQRFRQTGNVAALAREYTGFIRAFSEPVMAARLEGDAALMDRLYDRLSQRVTAEPERYLPRNIQAAMLLRRARELFLLLPQWLNVTAAGDSVASSRPSRPRIAC